MKKSMRRVSLRVVNFGGAGLGDHARIRLTDEDEKDDGEADAREIEEESDEGLSTLPLRGRTLCVMGPDNPLRRAFYRLLAYPVERQYDQPIRPRTSLSWVDAYAATSSIQREFETPVFAILSPDTPIAVCTLRYRLDFDFDLSSPAYPLPLVAEKIVSTADAAQKNMRDTGFVGNVLRSDRPRPETLSLPFKLSIQHARGKTDRNIPYLRHSWSRIDAVAIVSFWISFWLATGGAERGAGNHIEVFRAMSVIRTARLLTITSGTTATDTPSTLGAIIAEEIQLEGRFCGAFIDPTTLERVPYLLLNGENAPAPKGYTCPWDKYEDQNPESGVQGFDTIYMAALQVLIVASANGVWFASFVPLILPANYSCSGRP
ncbi:calcium channel protein [Salix suchowensis]|nr:calcium channel protein [Salix suchowensis]